MSIPWIRGNARFDRALDWRPGTAPTDTDRDALNGGWWQHIAWLSIGWLLAGLWLGMIVAVVVMRIQP